MPILTGSTQVFSGTITSRTILPTGDIRVRGTYNGRAFQQDIMPLKPPYLLLWDIDKENFYCAPVEGGSRNVEIAGVFL